MVKRTADESKMHETRLQHKNYDEDGLRKEKIYNYKARVTNNI